MATYDAVQAHKAGRFERFGELLGQILKQSTNYKDHKNDVPDKEKMSWIFGGILEASYSGDIFDNSFILECMKNVKDVPWRNGD